MVRYLFHDSTQSVHMEQTNSFNINKKLATYILINIFESLVGRLLTNVMIVCHCEAILGVEMSEFMLVLELILKLKHIKLHNYDEIIK